MFVPLFRTFSIGEGVQVHYQIERAGAAPVKHTPAGGNLILKQRNNGTTYLFYYYYLSIYYYLFITIKQPGTQFNSVFQALTPIPLDPYFTSLTPPTRAEHVRNRPLFAEQRNKP